MLVRGLLVGGLLILVRLLVALLLRGPPSSDRHRGPLGRVPLLWWRGRRRERVPRCHVLLCSRFAWRGPPLFDRRQVRRRGGTALVGGWYERGRFAFGWGRRVGNDESRLFGVGSLASANRVGFGTAIGLDVVAHVGRLGDHTAKRVAQTRPKVTTAATRQTAPTKSTDAVTTGMPTESGSRSTLHAATVP